MKLHDAPRVRGKLSSLPSPSTPAARIVPAATLPAPSSAPVPPTRSVFTAFAVSDTADGVAEATITFSADGAQFALNVTGAAPGAALAAAIGAPPRACKACM